MAKVEPDEEEFKRFCRRILSSQKYRTTLQIRLEEGTLSPAEHAMLVHYAFGKPTDKIAHTFPEGVPQLHEMSEAQLAAHAEGLAARLRGLSSETTEQNNHDKGMN